MKLYIWLYNNKHIHTTIPGSDGHIQHNINYYQRIRKRIGLKKHTNKMKCIKSLKLINRTVTLKMGIATHRIDVTPNKSYILEDFS